jgi:hypothetical protein
MVCANERKEKQMNYEDYEDYAAYCFTRNAKRHAGASDEEAHAAGVKALEDSVHGHDAKKDSRGNFIPQGIGAPGHESLNHFNSIRRYQGETKYQAAVREIYKRDPDRARKIGLEPPARATA